MDGKTERAALRFERLLKEAVVSCTPGLRLTAEAVDAMQEAAEA